MAVGVNLRRLSSVAAPQRACAKRFSEMAALRRAEPTPYPTRVFRWDTLHSALPKTIRASALAANDAGDRDGVPPLRS